MMAGRGRGRGRGQSINLEALGLGRGEILPTVAQPPPLFPPLTFKPVPLVQTVDLDYMLALKQELQESFHQSPFFIKAPDRVQDIERYSDKYQPGLSDTPSTWIPDWSRFPCELKEQGRKKRKIVTTVRPNLKAAKLVKDEDVSILLDKLEQNDKKIDGSEDVEGEEEGGDEKKKEKNDDDEEEEEEDYDEEDVEEETDYNLTYFDNGEGYGDDDEDDDEGPTY